MKLKYIITNQNSFAIFSEGNSHFVMARVLEGKPIGAGFCTIGIDTPYLNAIRGKEINVHCYGKSISLEISSRPKDEGIIEKIINNHY